jgi:hypothetical protein
MTLDEMIIDFCKRNKNDYGPEHIKIAMKNNFSYSDEYGFIIFAINQDECQGLFAYVIPGSPPNIFHSYMELMERVARKYNCRKIQFITLRPKAFKKILKDYSPTKAVVYEKRLV